MGGHEHHEGRKSSRAGAWEGHEKLKQALQGLATAKGVSQSRIGAVAKLAAHYAKVSLNTRRLDGPRRLLTLFVCLATVLQARGARRRDLRVEGRSGAPTGR
jgi:hypothetical protein